MMHAGGGDGLRSRSMGVSHWMRAGPCRPRDAAIVVVHRMATAKDKCPPLSAAAAPEVKELTCI